MLVNVKAAMHFTSVISVPRLQATCLRLRKSVEETKLWKWLHENHFRNMMQDQLSQTAEGNELTACGIFGMHTFSPYSHGCIAAADWVACQHSTAIMESSNTKVFTGALVVMLQERSSEWPSERNRKAAVQMLNPKGDPQSTGAASFGGFQNFGRAWRDVSVNRGLIFQVWPPEAT